MRRTWIDLAPELAQALDRLAEQRGMTRAEIIPQAARDFVRQEKGSPGSILGLAGLGHGGSGRVSEQHDDYLVGSVRVRQATAHPRARQVP